MPETQLVIGFARRGFSRSGGAESYLQRLARGVTAAGHPVRLFASADWPAAEWPFGEIVRLDGRSPRAFADGLAAARRQSCDVLMSLERVWSCDVYRAGDGVHAAWLARRGTVDGTIAQLLRRFSSKHPAILALERSLFETGGAGCVIANSEMAKAEITRSYGYPAERIVVVRNGVPIADFTPTTAAREAARAKLNLSADQTAVAFVGSGWERKGLRVAIEAVEACSDPSLRLLVAGRGNEGSHRSSAVRFLGELPDVRELLHAADMFVLPTLYDPFSNACLEALAAGLPVITTGANGFAEIIENGVHGSVVADPGDVGGFVDAIRFWSDSTRRAQALPKILERAAASDIRENVTQTLAVLLQAARAASTSGTIKNT